MQSRGCRNFWQLRLFFLWKIKNNMRKTCEIKITLLYLQ